MIATVKILFLLGIKFQQKLLVKMHIRQNLTK